VSKGLHISWDAIGDANRREWNIYVSRNGNLKGRLVHTSRDEDRWYKWLGPVGELTYYVHVLSVNMAGIEEDWKKSAGDARITVSRAENIPSAPSRAGAAQVAGAMGIRAVLDAPVDTDPPQVAEVIRGPSASRGQVVARFALDRDSLTGEGGTRTVSGLIPAPVGRGPSNGSFQLNVRGITSEGRYGGSAATFGAAFSDLPNYESVSLASVVGVTVSNFQAYAASAGFSYAGGDGAYLKAIPNYGSAVTAAWGVYSVSDATTTRLGDQPWGSFYVTAATIDSDRLDLGSSQSFYLECYDEAQRKTEFGILDTLTWEDAACYTYLDNEQSDLVQQGFGPAMFGRVCTLSGGRIDALPPTAWWYRAAATTTAVGAMTWTPYVGAPVRLTARYIDTRFRLADPVGTDQVVSPQVRVTALFPTADRLLAVRTVTGAYSPTRYDRTILTSSAMTLTLPDAVGHSGRSYLVRNKDGAAALTLAHAGAGDIDGAATKTVAAGVGHTLISDGTDWWTVG